MDRGDGADLEFLEPLVVERTIPGHADSPRRSIRWLHLLIVLGFILVAALLIVAGAEIRDLRQRVDRLEASLRTAGDATSTSTRGLSGPQRARRVVDMQAALGVDMHYSFPLLAESLSSDTTPESCRTADDDGFHRNEVRIAYARSRETPDHWTRVEAGFIAGACLEEVRMFLESVNRLGYGKVADQVLSELLRLGVPI